MSSPPLSNTFEGGTDGVIISGANSGGASGNAFDNTPGNPTFTAAQKMHGGLAVAITDATAGLGVNWTGFGGITADLWIRYYLWIPAWPTGANLRTHQYLDAGGVNHGAFEVQTSGRPRWHTGLAATQGSVDFPVSQWTRVEMRMRADTSVGQIEVRWYATPDSTGAPTDTWNATGLNTGAGTASMAFGSMNSFPTTPYTIYLDDLAVSTTDWIGTSFVPPVVPGPNLWVLRSPYRLN